jgi:hypothetical protein
MSNATDTSNLAPIIAHPPKAGGTLYRSDRALAIAKDCATYGYAILNHDGRDYIIRGERYYADRPESANNLGDHYEIMEVRNLRILTDSDGNAFHTWDGRGPSTSVYGSRDRCGTHDDGGINWSAIGTVSPEDTDSMIYILSLAKDLYLLHESINDPAEGYTLSDILPNA